MTSETQFYNGVKGNVIPGQRISKNKWNLFSCLSRERRDGAQNTIFYYLVIYGEQVELYLAMLKQELLLALCLGLIHEGAQGIM